MHLSPREEEHLLLHQAGFLAQKRLARGLKLNYVEAVALITAQVLEFIRDGKSVAELMSLGKTLLGRRQVVRGVPELMHELQVEGTFPDGTKLVTVHDAISRMDGDMELAMYGSFLPIPDLKVFYNENEDHTEEQQIVPMEGNILLNEGRPVTKLTVTNLGDRPIQVGSHYHLIETNPFLEMDRAMAYGSRLNIPAGTAVRFEVSPHFPIVYMH